MNRASEEISMVDLGKLFFSFCVLGIHTHAFPQSKFIHTYIFALAVPFFFICSGFFLGRKINHVKSKGEYCRILYKYGKRLFVPYLVWGVWYFVLEVCASILSERIALKQSIIKQIASWILTSPGGGLWYVQSLLILLVVLQVSNKKKYRRFLLCLSVVLSTIPGILSYFNFSYSVFGIDAFDSHVFIWDGLFFLFGLTMGEHDSEISKFSFKSLLFGLAMIVTFKVMMVHFDVKPLLRLINMLNAVPVFILLYKTVAPYGLKLSICLREMSTIIYFTHITIKYAVQMGFKICHIPESTLVFVVSAILLLLYAYINRRFAKGTKLYKLLYS